MRDRHAPDKQGFIPGVFNYCDRRCERCRFVRHCRVGAMEIDDLGTPGADVADERPEDYEERLRKMMDMAAEDDDEEGEGGAEGGFQLDFDPNDIEPDPDYEKKEEEIQKQLDAHPLSNLGMTYMDLSTEWMEEREEKLVQRGVPMRRRPMLVDTGSPEDMILREAVDELSWFRMMLHVKCQRAIHGKLQDPSFMEDIGMDPHQSDHNGTAKLALHIVDRCQVAWTTVAEMMPEEADDILPAQELLRRIAIELEKEFPDTDKFIRAGFDAPRQPVE